MIDQTKIVLSESIKLPLHPKIKKLADMSLSIFDQLNQILLELQESQVNDAEALESFRIKYLGSKNILKPLGAEIRHVPNERKREFGQLLNQIKDSAQEKYDQLKNQVSSTSQTQQRSELDLTMSTEELRVGSQHPVTLVMNRIVEIFSRIGFVIAEDREIEDDWHNFTAMNTPEHHPARDMQDTFYLKDSKQRLLRTHTSSVQARVMTSQKPPIRIIAPGRVYRNETISARSHCQFHQVEGLYVDKNVSFADMKQTLLYYAKEMYGADVKIRLRPSYFPFTEPSAEMDVYWGLHTERE